MRGGLDFRIRVSDLDSVELRAFSWDISLVLPLIMRDERGGTRHEAMDECFDGPTDEMIDLRNGRFRVDDR